jgi:hypothetical protein
MKPALVARPDPSLSAQVIRREPLLYSDAVHETEDRPAFVRAASGLARFGDSLAIVQDDASFVAIRNAQGHVRAIPLTSGRRRFEDRLGNRLDKLDLESCVAIREEGRDVLLAFGSGSLPVREVVAVVDLSEREPPRVVKIEALHASLRSALGAPRALNLEGAARCRDRLRLFERGAGESAVFEVELGPLLAWIAAGALGVPPPARLVDKLHLGVERGVPFGITDVATLDDDHQLFLAAAEDTDDPVHDGAVLGSLLGVLGPTGVRVTKLKDERGEWAPLKAEGLAPQEREGFVWVVLDADDPDVPADLCEVRVASLRKVT